MWEINYLSIALWHVIIIIIIIIIRKMNIVAILVLCLDSYVGVPRHLKSRHATPNVSQDETRNSINLTRSGSKHSEVPCGWQDPQYETRLQWHVYIVYAYIYTLLGYIYIYIYIYIYRNCILVWELLFKPAQVGLLDDPLTSALLGEGLERGFPCSMAAWGLLQNSLNRPRTPGARHSHTWHHKILAGVMQFDSTVQRPPSNFTVFAMSVQPANGDQMRCTNRIKSHQGTWWLGTQVEFEP